MVPVAGLPAAAGAADPPAGLSEVRRLPPVAPAVSAVTERQAVGRTTSEPYAATFTP